MAQGPDWQFLHQFKDLSPIIIANFTGLTFSLANFVKENDLTSAVPWLNNYRDDDHVDVDDGDDDGGRDDNDCDGGGGGGDKECDHEHEE